MNYKFMNYALEHTEGNEFRVLYFIANTLNMKKVNRCKIYNEAIADYLNMDKRSVMRMTKKLEDKNLLKKDLVSEHGKSKVYYSLNYDVLNCKDGTKNAPNLCKDGTDNASILDKSVTLNNNEKEITKTNNDKMNEKELIHYGTKQDLDPIIHNNINAYMHNDITTEHGTEEVHIHDMVSVDREFEREVLGLI